MKHLKYKIIKQNTNYFLFHKKVHNLYGQRETNNRQLIKREHICEEAWSQPSNSN